MSGGEQHRSRLPAIFLIGAIVAAVAQWGAIRNPWNLVVLEEDVASFLLAVEWMVVFVALAVSAQWRTWWTWRRERRAARKAMPSAVRLARRVLGFVVGCVIMLAVPLLLIGFYGSSARIVGYFDLADERSGLKVSVDIIGGDSVCEPASRAMVQLHDDRGLFSRRIDLERNDDYDCLGYEAEFPERGVVVLVRDCERVTITYDPSNLDVRDRQVEDAPCHSSLP